MSAVVTPAGTAPSTPGADDRTADDRTAGEASSLARALSLPAWPLAVLGPLWVWTTVVAVIAGRSPDVVVDGGCSQPWGPCAAPMADVVSAIGRVGQAPIVLLGGTLALAAVRGMPVRRRLIAVLVALVAEAIFLALVGATALEIGGDLG